MKVGFRVIAISSLFSFLVVTACSKKEESDCKTCKALNPNGTVADERTICTQAEETNFRRDNPDREIVCN
jgi:hypothetical protein